MDTKKLRQKILDLAIHGKLVPQDPNDEPASVLLERIRAEKERLIAEGKIKRSKKSATSDTSHYENVPFEVPEGWYWCKINDIAFVTKLAGFEFTKYITDNLSKSEGIPLFKGKNVQGGEIIYEFESYIPEEISDELFRSQVTKKCLLTPYVGTLGNIGIHDKQGKYHLGSNVGKIEIFNTDSSTYIHEEYIKSFLMSSDGYKELTKHKKATAQESISIDAIRDIFIPVPPTSEQERIIDECNKLFSFVSTIEISESKITEYIIQAKSKILDLAIHGKLVPQDPNDEPAIELLKRINPKFVPCDNAHYENVPNSWCWTTLGEVCELITGSTPSKLHPEYYGGDFPFYKPTDLDVGRHVAIPSEFLTGEGKKVSRVIPVGATAICCIGSIGKCGYIEKEGATNQQINTAVPSKSLHPLYLYYFCNSTFFVEELTADSSAITISIVNKSKLSKMLIPIPPYKEQQRIVTKIEKLLVVLDNISAEL